MDREKSDSPSSLIAQFEEVLATHNATREELLNRVRPLILQYGIPEVPKDSNGYTLRGKIWKLLTGCCIDADLYRNLVSRGEHPKRGEYYNDMRRSGTIHQQSARKQSSVEPSANSTVRQENGLGYDTPQMFASLDRIIGCYYHMIEEDDSFPNYQQGQSNQILMFLKEMPEVDSFAMFLHMYSFAPTYRFCKGAPRVQWGLDRARELIVQVLKTLDPNAHAIYLKNSLFSHELYFNINFFFGGDNTALRNDVPFLRRLWDLGFAFGAHLWALYNAALFMIIVRDNTYNYPFSQSQFAWPIVDGDEIVQMTLRIIHTLSTRSAETNVLLTRIMYHVCYLGE